MFFSDKSSDDHYKSSRSIRDDIKNDSEVRFNLLYSTMSLFVYVFIHMCLYTPMFVVYVALIIVLSS